MRLKKKFDNALTIIKAIEGQYAERCKNGSKNQDDYLEMSYFSGLLNGFKFVWHIMDTDITEEEFDKMLKTITHQEYSDVN